jgi:hypothetical protein
VGRSGVRIEKGVSTSGLLGERLMLSDDPQRNSLVQRVWLYNDDPALKYRCSVRALLYCAYGVLTCCDVMVPG